MRSSPSQGSPAFAHIPGGFWIYGLHPVRAALSNPNRRSVRLLATEHAAEEIGTTLLKRVRVEKVAAETVSRTLPPGAVHQGAALYCLPLPKRSLRSLLAASPQERRIVVVLDQISDPHNVGAILRTSAAFNVSALVVQTRHSPSESGALAKAASGGLDIVPYLEVVNIARALGELGREGFWRIALLAGGDNPVRDALAPGDIALVLGSEGAGIRRLVREQCDASAFIPSDPGMQSLNVSNAAAVALYELRRE